MPVREVEQMKSGKEAVGEVVELRLRFYYGGWWEDRTKGFRIPQFLSGNARKGDVDLLAKYIGSYVAQTEGVKSVTDIVANVENHRMIFACAVLTEDNQTAVVEVDVDVL